MVAVALRGGGRARRAERAGSEGTLRALAIPREGRTIALAQPLRTEVAQTPPRVAHQVTLAHLAVHGGPDPDGSGVTAFEDQLTISSHAGCHVDGLGHCGIDGRGYNGVPTTELYDPSGLTALGVETRRPLGDPRRAARRRRAPRGRDAARRPRDRRRGPRARGRGGGRRDRRRRRGAHQHRLGRALGLRPRGLRGRRAGPRLGGRPLADRAPRLRGRRRQLGLRGDPRHRRAAPSSSTSTC